MAVEPVLPEISSCRQRASPQLQTSLSGECLIESRRNISPGAESLHFDFPNCDCIPWYRTRSFLQNLSRSKISCSTVRSPDDYGNQGCFMSRCLIQRLPTPPITGEIQTGEMLTDMALSRMAIDLTEVVAHFETLKAQSRRPPSQSVITTRLCLP